MKNELLQIYIIKNYIKKKHFNEEYKKISGQKIILFILKEKKK